MIRVPVLAAAIGTALTVLPAAHASTAPVSARQASPPKISANLIHPSARPVALREAYRQLHVTYTYNGKQHTLSDFLARSQSRGFVVLHGADIVYERYRQASRDTRMQSWSMAKSFTATAVGIAVAEGRIHSISDPVTKYLPALRHSGYDGVSIRNLLRMSSGIKWNEDQDAPRLQVAAQQGRQLEQMAAKQVRGFKPGSKFNYTSMNYFVLAWLVRKTTGMSYAQFADKTIWKPAGMASTAYIANDTHGDNLGYCCFYATDRDYARFGLLYLHSGKARGRQVVPRSWVGHETAPSSSFQRDYGLGWWLDENGSERDFMAIGLGGQYIYVSPARNVVIVESAHNNPLRARKMQPETLTAFRAVAAKVAG
jgi:CubicO group peptidase (beta-lactamase class C family)